MDFSAMLTDMGMAVSAAESAWLAAMDEEARPADILCCTALSANGNAGSHIPLCPGHRGGEILAAQPGDTGRRGRYNG